MGVGLFDGVMYECGFDGWGCGCVDLCGGVVVCGVFE